MNWQTVFDAYPKVNEIYVVAGMPFLEERQARAHAIQMKSGIQTIKRPGKSPVAIADDADALEATQSADAPNPSRGRRGKKS